VTSGSNPVSLRCRDKSQGVARQDLVSLQNLGEAWRTRRTRDTDVVLRGTAQFPIGRIVEPSDIASMILFLALPHSSAVTRQSIVIDGDSTAVTNY
jgi:NAD(P)-dependent dehydrogenase (short-subunit alcohol dehydrogenase family)